MQHTDSVWSVSLHLDSGNVFFHFETREEDARHSAWRRFLTLSTRRKAMEKKWKAAVIKDALMSETLCTRSCPHSLSLFDALYRLSRKKRRAAISIGKKREKKRENCTSELVLLTREIARSNDAKLFLRWKGIANRWNNPLYSFDEIIFCKVKGISKGENILTILMKIIPFLRNRCTTTFPTFVKMKFKGREVHDNFTANFIIR